MIVPFSLQRILGTQTQSGSLSYLNIFRSSSSSSTKIEFTAVVDCSSLPFLNRGGSVRILALWSFRLRDADAPLTRFLLSHQKLPSDCDCASDTIDKTNKTLQFFIALLITRNDLTEITCDRWANNDFIDKSVFEKRRSWAWAWTRRDHGA